MKAYPPFCEAVTEKGRPFWRLSLHFIKASKHIDFNLLYSLRKILELQHKQKSIKNSFWITNSNVQIKLNQFLWEEKNFVKIGGLGFKGLWEGLRCVWMGGAYNKTTSSWGFVERLHCLSLRRSRHCLN